jgi:hypothetical protein
MLNDSCPGKYPGCLSTARKVLQQVVQDTGVQNVTFLEFQEEAGTVPAVVCCLPVWLPLCHVVTWCCI